MWYFPGAGFLFTMIDATKLDDNTPVEDIDIVANPATESLLFRYLFASHWCKGKRVLDAACGHGIGTKMLKILGAKEVTGIDISEVAIDRASDEQVDGVDFKIVDLCDDQERMGLYDTIISIETFEHLPPDKIDIYMNNLKKWCKPGGTIIITTPRRQTVEWKWNGGTHLMEYSIPEFKEILIRHFGVNKCKILGIQEVDMGIGQLMSIIMNDRLYDARVLVAIYEHN